MTMLILKNVALEMAREFIEFKEAAEKLTIDFLSEVITAAPKVPERIAEKLVKESIEIADNWETTTILVLATIGTSAIIGRVIFKIPIPPIVDKKMLGPVIAVMIVRSIAQSAERGNCYVDDKQNACQGASAI